MGQVRPIGEWSDAALAEWRRSVRRHCFGSGREEAAFTEHLPALFDWVMAALEETDGGQSSAVGQDLREFQILDRLTGAADVRQLTIELSLLRQVLVREWTDSEGRVSAEELERLNRVIDGAVLHVTTARDASREHAHRTLDRVSMAALEHDTLDAFLPTLLSVLQADSPAIDFIAVLLKEGDLLRCYTEAGVETGTWRGRVLKLGLGFAGHIAQQRQPRVLRTDGPLSPEERETIEHTGARVLFGVPLVFEGEVVGVAEIGSRQAADFGHDEQELFQEAARRVTAFIARARAVEAHRRNQEIFQAVLDSATALVFVKDAAGHYLQVNQLFAAVFRRDRQALIGRSSYELQPENLAATIRANDQQVLSTGQPLQVEEVVLVEPGQRRTFLSLKYPLHDADGKPYAIAGISTDITARKREEEERAQLLLREQAARQEAEQARILLDTFLSCSPIGFAFFGYKASTVRLNPAMAAMFGLTAGDNAHVAIRGGLPKDVVEHVDALIRDVLATGCSVAGRGLRLETPPGSGRFAQLLGHFYPVRDSNGELLGVGAAVTDITERLSLLEQVQEARAEAERSLAMLDAIFASAPIGFAFLDPQLRFVRVNEALADLGGNSVETYLGRMPHELLLPLPAPELAALVDEPLRSVLETGRPILGRELAMALPDAPDRLRHWMVNQFPVRTPDGKIIGVGSSVVEITEQKQAEARAAFLSQATETLSSSLDYEATLARVAELAIPQLGDWCMVHVRDQDGTIRCLALAHRDQARKEAARRIIDRHPLRPDAPGPIPEVLRSGTARLAEEAFEEELAAVIGPKEENLRLLRAIKLKSVLFLPLLSRGQPLGVITFAMAESGRRFSPADRAFAEELVRRAALAVENARHYKLAQEAIRIREDFLSMASHDLRSPIGGLILQTQLLLHQAEVGRTDLPREPTLRSLEAMDRQLANVSSMLDSLLDVSRIHAGKVTLVLEELDLVALTREVTDQLAETLLKAGCTCSISAERHVVGQWDRMRLEQVITNLLSNAAKYGAGKPIEISIWKTPERVCLRVQDHGVGIARDEQLKLFRRFERVGNPSAFKGNGLGLWIARNMVERMGGQIELASAPGEGAAFTVSLPEGVPAYRN